MLAEQKHEDKSQGNKHTSQEEKSQGMILAQRNAHVRHQKKGGKKKRGANKCHAIQLM